MKTTKFFYEETDKKCQNCYYFKPETEQSGNCLRFPPQVVFSHNSMEKTIRFMFPRVNQESACGEFQKPKESK